MTREDYELISGNPIDPDFPYPHLDDPRIGASPEEIKRITEVEDDNESGSF